MSKVNYDWPVQYLEQRVGADSTPLEDFELQYVCGRASSLAGWWTNPNPDVPKCLMLIVSEVAEAMEADRKGLSDDKLPHRDGVEVELADAVIRIFDLAEHAGMDVVSAMREKIAYNLHRYDHKPENRAAEGGKKY